VLYTGLIFPEYIIFIKINTSLFGILFENDPVHCVHVPCDMSVVSHVTCAVFLFWGYYILESSWLLSLLLLVCCFCLLSQAFSS